MSLLFDANLSPRLTRRLADLFPGSIHVEVTGLTSSDPAIWQYAVAAGLTIVTKDEDFEAMALVLAPPGKVILIKLGNCHTDLVEDLFRRELSLIREFLSSPSETLLALP
jgi:predicted nuclease of predicted toxin-antitoxin system